MKIVSVIIPTYKRPNMIVRAVNSVINQTYKDIEIIVVDDNDPNTPERLETELAMQAFKNNPKVKYIKHERNKNGSAARNTGWRTSIGDYITFLDDDDEIDEKKIEKQVLCLEALNDNWGACYTAYYILKNNGAVIKSATKSSGNIYIQALMRTFYLGSGSNLLLRRKAIEYVNGYDETFQRNQDVEFLVRIAEKFKMAYIPDFLLTVHYEVRQFKRSFEFIDNIALYYLNKFENRIHGLNKRDQQRVITVISLERARVAIAYKEYLKAFKIVRNNNISILHIVKYIKYLLHRICFKESYGFYF